MKTLTLIISILLTAQVLFGQHKIDTSFYSESLGEVKMVDVYFPPGYNENPDLYYPVVYYLHGWHADQNDLGSMISWVTYLINNDIIEPCLMVAADNSPDPFDGSCYVNSSLWGNYEDYMVNDLVSWVENSFRAVPQKDYRSLMGHSMGGVGSFRLGLLHPETYCAFAAHAAEVNVDLFVEDIRQELLSENSGPPYSYSWEGGGFFTQWMFLAGGAFTPNSNTPQTYIDPPIVEFPFDENCNLIDTVYQKWQLFDVPAILHDVSPDDSVGIFFSCGMNDFLHIFPANLALKDTLDALGFQSVFLPHDGDHVMPPEFKQGGLKFLDSIMGSPLLIPGEPEIIHVPGDYPTIQQGINAATPGDTVLVADGTYFEQINFLGKKPLTVASEFLMDGDTNHIANTIIDGSQLTNPDSASVVYFISGEDTTSTLCGFTIQHGKGTYYLQNSGYTCRTGGGIFITGSGAKIIHNHITENHLNDTLITNVQVVEGAGIGGKWIMDDHWVVIDHNVIDHNSTYSENTFSLGAGLLAYNNSRITYNNISNNTSTSKSGCKSAGAGFMCSNDPSWINPVTAIVQHNVIINNLCELQNGYGLGGGGYFQSVTGIFSDNYVLNNSITGENLVYGGGGLYLWEPDPGFVISNNVFKENVSDLFAGAIGMRNNAFLDNPVLVENNYFIGNAAKNAGALSTITVPVTLQNNVFSGNHAEENGGATYLWWNSVALNDHFTTLINNSFYDNTATMNGGAIFSRLAKPLIFNSVFWDDNAASGSEIYSNFPTDTVEIGFSAIDLNAIQGGGFTIDGSGNINEDPLFEDLELLTISENSPCVNTGIEEYTCHYGDLHVAPAYDIAGHPRPLNEDFDMGAYEELQGQVIRVPADYPTIQLGINAATPGDTVLVSDGTYYEQINFLGKKPLMVASEFLMDGDTNHIANTIIDGSQLTNLDSASVVYFISGEDTTSTLCGFTIQHGKGTFYITIYTNRAGGGVFITGSGAKIIHNHITENHLNDTLSGSAQIVQGAGVASKWIMDDHWVVIDHNVIDHNSTYSEGFLNESSAAGLGVFCNSRVIHNIISDNTSTGKSASSAIGAGFFCGNNPDWTYPVTTIVQHNVIINNLCEVQDGYGLGGGGYFQQIPGIFSDNYVANNSITGENLIYGGGGLYLWEPDPGFVISNNVFKENVSDHYAGALGMRNNASLNNPVRVENNYFIDNIAKNAGALITINVPIISQNNVFSGNHAEDNGGALFLWWNSVAPNDHFATLINNSFYDNTATMNGGAIFSKLAKPLIFNSVFWNDNATSGSEIYSNLPTDTVELAYSNINTSFIEGGQLIDGGGNVNEDPLYEDPELLTLSELSPCINKGTEAFTCQCGTPFPCPEHDIIGVLRPQNGLVDMGAYETILQGIWDYPLNNTGLRHSLNPNPFTNQAKFSYELDSKTQVEINLYNSSGELIQILLSEQQEAGKQELQFSSGNLQAGVYFYRITTDSKQATGRMILLK